MNSQKHGNGKRKSLLSGVSIMAAAAAALTGTPAMAQDSEEDESIIVTGSRIVRQDFIANSPITTVTGEEVVGNADVTLETFLNTLPQVNPAGTTTSNNPGNGGQSNVNLRGLGANRNIVLIDGRRPMVSSNTLNVDLNTIPAAMIGSVEVITGGAGAAYGADAIAGAVNVRLREDFEGADFRVSYANQSEHWDAEEYNVSAVIGGEFADGRGNALFGFDRSFREEISKGQRPFSAFATSTTGTPPEGAIIWSGTNAVPQASIDALFGTAGYGSNAPGAAAATSGRFGFNQNGSIIFYGRPANPDTVLNWDDPITIAQNPRFFPDFYSYNFDAVNALVLPLDRYSFMFDMDYETESGLGFFAQAGWTNYVTDTRLAPTPLPGVAQRNSADASFDPVLNVQNNTHVFTRAQCLLNPNGSAANCSTAGVGNLLLPVTNPFVSANADLMSLLNARVGDDPYLVGAGANEPIRYAFRPLGFGPRRSVSDNTVIQFLVGTRGDIGDTGWDYEAYISEGRTQVDITQFGNINTQTLQNVLNNPVGTPCAAWNPLGNNALPGACRTHLESPVQARNEFNMRIGQAFVRGDLFEMPAGPLSTVFGVEHREFDYTAVFLSPPGPFSGFNVGPPEGGNNSFFDIFAEALVPIIRDAPFAQNVELGLGYRRSTFSFEQTLPTVITGPEQDGEAYKAELNWEFNDAFRARASFQRSVRAPNFGELFAASTSFPQIHDPCNVYSEFRTGADNIAGNTAAEVNAANLCVGTGVPGGSIATYAAPPGGQARIIVHGNTNLSAEQGDTYSVGLVYRSTSDNDWLSRFQASIDYYLIEVNDPILAIDTNVAIADCYNFYGNNPGLTVAGNSFCQGVTRQGAGNTINEVVNPVVVPGVPAGRFPGENGGFLSAEGIDLSAVWGFDVGWLGLPDDWGSVDVSLVVNKLLAFTRQDRESLPELDYSGTISFFGAGLGTSFPEYRATVGVDYSVGPFGLEYRARYIHEMINRMQVIFPGETNFGQNSPPGVDSLWYHDIAATWDVTDNVRFRLGVNNVADEQPPEYAPNVQSGTEPSLYDVVGRRSFAQLILRY